MKILEAMLQNPLKLGPPSHQRAMKNDGVLALNHQTGKFYITDLELKPIDGSGDEPMLCITVEDITPGVNQRSGKPYVIAVPVDNIACMVPLVKIKVAEEVAPKVDKVEDFSDEAEDTPAPVEEKREGSWRKSKAKAKKDA